MAKAVTQKPILKSDVESTAPETKKKTTTSIRKSRRKTSIEEFALTKNLRPEFVAGFKAWLKGQYFHFDEEWEKLYENYKNRQL